MTNDDDQTDTVRFDFRSRNVLISGGTSGIGRGIALAFARAGANVTVTGRTKEEVDSFDAEGTAVVPVAMDVADESSVRNGVARFKCLDFLVNCAGTIARNGAEHDPREFAKIIDVNLTGTMRLSHECHGLLKERSGAVVNLASMLSFFGSGFVPAYSASKGGVAQLTKSLAIAWADDNIRVNAIAPGWIETPLTAPLVHNPTRRDDIIARTPMRRWGSPCDVSGAVLFLCSTGARFITGAILPVDGGYSIA